MSETILISDDEPLVAQLFSRVLEEAGYRTQSIPTGDARATLAACRQSPPDILITDIKKPGPDGLALCRALRRDPHTRRIAIMVLSGYYPLPGGTHVMMAGADSFQPKPIGIPQLLRATRELLATAAIGLRLHPVTSLAPWPVLDEWLHRFCRTHDWSLLSTMIEPRRDLQLFAWTIQKLVDRHADLWLAHDTAEERLLIAGAPATIDQVQADLLEHFPMPAADLAAPRLHLMRFDGARHDLRALVQLFPDPMRPEAPATA